MKYIIGIDEAGRGPLAGPVSIGGFLVKSDFDFSLFEGLKDSKKLSEIKRKNFFRKIIDLQKQGEVNFAFSLVSNIDIDKYGISFALKKGIRNVLKKIDATYDMEIFLDGSIYAPKEFVNQKTIIKGDELIPVISLASIVAKVVRDEFMKKQANLFPEYGFDVHKGYGTKRHIEMVKKYGLSQIHRRSFCRSLIK